MVLPFNILDLVLHFKVPPGEFLQQYGLWTYVILFLILFCECGIVLAAFLPGDSMLFVAGALAGTGDAGYPHPVRRP